MEADGTAKDSDVAEVEAVQSIFSDVIEEIIRQVEKKFKDHNLDESISKAFLLRSKSTKKYLNEALTQTAIAAILKPYMTHLKEFTAKGFEIAP